MGSKDYIVDLTLDDRKRFYVETKRGKVVRFVVQFETFVNKQRRPVIRYDTAHGYAHKDILDWHGRVIEKIEMVISTTRKLYKLQI